MADRVAAERACKDPNPIIDGRKANVNLAYLGAKPRGIVTGESRKYCGRRGDRGRRQWWGAGRGGPGTAVRAVHFWISVLFQSQFVDTGTRGNLMLPFAT